MLTGPIPSPSPIRRAKVFVISDSVHVQLRRLAEARRQRIGEALEAIITAEYERSEEANV